MDSAVETVKVIQCKPGPQPKKVTARSSSKNLRQHFEGFLSVNMTDMNAELAESLLTPLKPEKGDLSVQEKYWADFYKMFCELCYYDPLVKTQKIVEHARWVKEVYPRVASTKGLLLNLTAWAFGYNDVEEMEENKVGDYYRVRARLTPKELTSMLKQRMRSG